MNLFDKILKVLELYPLLMKSGDNRVMGHFINFEVNHKPYFILINDDYGRYKSKPWMFKLFTSPDSVGCYSIYKGKYGNAHWDLLQKDSLKKGSERLTRLKLFDKLLKNIDRGDNIIKSDEKLNIELNVLEEAIDKLLEKKNVT